MLKQYDKQIANDTQLAASMPKWYARTTVVDFARAKDGEYLDLSRGTSYQVGDRLMFIQCNNFEQALTDDLGQVYTVSEATASGRYKFEQGIPAIDSGLYFVILFLENKDHAADVREALIPVTIEMIDQDRKDETHPLRAIGLKQPGWYRWRSVSRTDRDPMITCELLVSMKGFHSPDSTSTDSGEAFDPDLGGTPDDSGIRFDENGEITLG